MIRENKKKLKSPIRFSFGVIFTICVVVYVLYVGGEKSIENYRLKSNGICIKAKVISKNKVGGKGVIYTHYSFKVSNQNYEGFSSDDDSVLIGDSIIVVYLISNPNINRSNTFLEKDCY